MTETMDKDPKGARFGSWHRNHEEQCPHCQSFGTIYSRRYEIPEEKDRSFVKTKRQNECCSCGHWFWESARNGEDR